MVQRNPWDRRRAPYGSVRRRTMLALAAVMVTIAAPFIGVLPAYAGIGVSPIPDFPTTVTVGETFTGRLNLINNTTPPESAQPVTVSDIRFYPSCETGNTDCLGGIEPGVFSISGPFVGGPQCHSLFSPAGVLLPAPVPVTFTITETAPGSGIFLVTPSARLDLAAGEICTIDFTATTLRVPTVDLSVAPGIQTQALASNTVASPLSPSTVRNTGIDPLTVLQAATAITTVAVPASAPVGTPVHDTAQVTGLVSPTGTGTVTFTLFSDAACTVAVPGGASTVPVTAGGLATSANVTPPTTGTYHWVATFSGDANNLPSGPTACADPAETVVVTAATPTLVTNATPATAPLGTSINDTAMLSGGFNPTGTITFRLYRDNACATEIFNSTNPLVPGPGSPFTTATATSGPFTVNAAGTYRWVATYSGDVNNAPAGPTACLDPLEDVAVPLASPTIATLADPTMAQIGNTVRDTATVSGGFNPTGTVTFRLFSDAACTVQIFVSTNPLVAGVPATATSNPFNIPAAGTYHWVATYSGDANNNPAGPTACADPLEQITVPRANTSIATTASPAMATVGSQIRDAASVSFGSNPTGTVTFQLFSDPPTCAVQVFTSTNTLDPVTRTVMSDPYTVTAPGTYQWVATYNGDANNNPSGPSPCTDLNERVTVAPAAPTIATVATPAGATIGQQVHDTATITGGFNPTGTVTFRLYSDAACTVQVFTSTSPVVTGPPATATSGNFTTVAAGTFHWTATYSGDANNAPAGPTACLDPAEQVVVAVSMPTIATTASPGVAVGAVVFDTATVSGGSNPTGTVTFQLYSDAACTVQVFSSTNTLNPATRVAQSGNFTTTAPGTYHWVATYSGDANNATAGPTACADPAEQVVVAQAAPTITTTASPTVTVGGVIFDRATVAGGLTPTGTVTFNLFGPGDTTCTTSIFTSTTALNSATGMAQSANFTTAAPGTYRWVARYNGDANNLAAGPTACLDPAELVVVTQANPLITTQASGTVVLGSGTISDTATVTGLVAPSAAGTVTFTLFGPNNATCTGAPIFTATTAVNPATGVATSGPFTPTAAGTYRFIARYNGDANNAPAGPTACSDPLEAVVVNPANPTIVTAASAPVPVGGQIRDTASLGGGVNPTGTITFSLFGPNNATCTGAPAFTNTVPVNGNGSYQSAQFTTTAAGTYRWIAAYSGDANNAPAGPTACADPLEQTDATRFTPTLVTAASAGNVGSSVFDTATLSGGFNPTGTITFTLFNNETCTGAPLFTSTRPVMGNGNVVSETFILPAPGVYHFVASYSGDANNNPVGPTACLDPAEAIGAGRLAVTLATQASAGVSLGAPISDTATLGAGLNPTGTITFTLFGPNNATCTGTPIFTSTVTVTGNGTYPSGPFTPTAPGTYRWIAAYSGDVNNAPATTPCADPLEQVIVTGLPTIMIDKTAVPLSLPVPGGAFTFDLVVTNTGPVPVTITSLTDNVYGNVTTIAGGTCGNAIGTVLAASPGPGNTYSCRFTGNFTGPSGATQTDTATVTGVDQANNPVSDTDDAIVTITPVPPSITTTKVPTPTSLPEPGGTFTFNYSVTNTGPEPVTVTSIVDNVYGDLNGKGTCAIGAVLAANGGTYRCSFTGNFFGNAGASQVDTISTSAVDARGVVVTSMTMATVTITDVPPTITIVKSPDPVSRPEPGGTFRFTVKVTNTSFEPVTITSLKDDIYGDLNGRGSCAIGAVLAANGGSYSCAFDGNFTGKAGDSQTDTVTVIAVDNDNTTVTANAKATVTLTPVNTPPVVPPPPPPVIPITPQILVRTGSDLSGPARMAGLFLIVGMTLVAASRWFGEGGPAVATVPSGGPKGRGPGGGGHWFGDDNWFGGARVHPPRGPFGGAGAKLLQPPAAAPDLGWDAWVGTRAPAAPAAPRQAVVPPAPASAPPEPIVAEVVVPTVVAVRRTGGLDAAALDAAEALTAPARPPAPPAGRSRRKPGRF